MLAALVQIRRTFVDSLTRLCGYKNSRLVCAGNAAYQQLQLDIYLEMIDSMPPLFSCYS